MKTPREILLARHRAAEPKLDVLRQAVLKELNDSEASKQNFSRGLVSSLLRRPTIFWQEVILPSRRAWTGLAAVWLLIFIVNFAGRDPVSSSTGRTANSPAVWVSWQIQQKWMNELLADRSMPPDLDRPKNFMPRPRTANSQIMTA